MKVRGIPAALIAITAILISTPGITQPHRAEPQQAQVLKHISFVDLEALRMADQPPASLVKATATKANKVADPVVKHQSRSKVASRYRSNTNKRVSVSRETTSPAPRVSSSGLKGYAASLVGAAQFACLEPLWQHESGWSVTAGNSSGAYGIPQALPGRKMASAGSDWRTNGRTQIRWGVGYIAGRYGNSCNAYAHWRSHNWY